MPCIALILALAWAELTGAVTDSTGAAIAGASIVLTEVETNATTRTTSDTSGRYLFSVLKAGRYSITAEASGFQRIIRKGVTVVTGERIRLDFKLDVSGIEQSMTITSDAPLLRSESANLGQAIDNRKIVELPLNGRSFLSLIGLAPGVALPPGSAFPRINGGRPRVNEYLFDGVSVLQPEPGQVPFLPVIDAIQEFKVETNSPSAEFGRFNGGVVNLTTKSGANELHWSVFEFSRNESLNARNLFAPATRKPLFRRNQFGLVAGGPLVRDKTFFFTDYQGSRQRIERVRISTVPSAEFPQDRADPVAFALLQRYPLPTSEGSANNYRRIGAETQHQNQADLRLDHRFRNADQMFARMSTTRDVSDPVTPLPDGSGNLTSGVIGHARTDGESFGSNYLHVFGSNLTNEARFGYSRRAVTRRSISLPTYVIDGYEQLGPPPNAYSDSRTDVTHIVDNFTWHKAAHFLKAGADFRFERLDIVQPSSPHGLYRFTAQQTGSALQSFLLGLVDRFSIDIQEKPIRPRAYIQEYFLQDDWKASTRISVNAGVRYTLNFPSTEVDNQGAVFNLQTQKLDFLGRDGFPRSSRELHKLNFGPRLGIAYRASNKTVVRAAYGLVWIEQAGITTPFTNPQFPFIQTFSRRSPDGITPAFQLSAGPSVSPLPFTPDAGVGQGVFTVDRKLGSGYVQQWNVSIQRELSANLIFEAAYAGSKITHVGIPDTNINQLTVDQLRLGPQLLEGGRAQLLRPYPRFTTVSFFRNNVGDTNYHAFQTKVEKRFSRGISFLASYTHSKLIDDASSVFDAAVLTGPVADFPVADSFNRKLERDVSSGDVPNAFVFSGSWEPRRGWEVSGILTVQSGLPLGVTQITNFNAFAGFGTQRPNRLRDPKLPKTARTTSRYFDTNAFATAPQFTLGNSSRNPVRGPGLANLDLALIKRMTFRERYTVEFRAEVFNLTNTPPLGNPNVALGSLGFGSITSSGDPRVIQLAVKISR